MSDYPSELENDIREFCKTMGTDEFKLTFFPDGFVCQWFHEGIETGGFLVPYWMFNSYPPERLKFELTKARNSRKGQWD